MNKSKAPSLNLSDQVRDRLVLKEGTVYCVADCEVFFGKLIDCLSRHGFVMEIKKRPDSLVENRAVAQGMDRIG